jgi:hypothetical protein
MAVAEGAKAELAEPLELTSDSAGADELVSRIESEYARVEGALGALAGRA